MSNDLAQALGAPARDEPDIFFVKYPVGLAYLGKPIEFHTLTQAAVVLCERAKCDMRTFEYHGVIEAGPRPGKPEGERSHLWSAMERT